ncbi:MULTISPECIES: sporulation integral membrane protein YtvI [Allobacillus]|uniref:Sporulation integral membrane protein YtvI n=1 Tax=Allobacillus salarius TaxID=1955272 RepID=A0A556PQ26_9BACI|nr:sporulation integral membrane protein YtvI [Allobacillus salarius]TSJ66465.1 sporulation integral membrane protein YtvI [Allobacillus salarius]
MNIDWIKATQLTVTFIVVSTLFYVSLPILYPFYISIVLAIVILPLAKLLERKLYFPRGLAIFTMIFMLLVVSITVISLSMIELIHFLQQFSYLLPQIFDTTLQHFYETIFPWTEKVIGTLSNLLSKSPDFSKDYFTQLLRDFANSLREYSQNFLLDLVQSLILLFTNTLQSSYIFILILLSTYFLAKDGPRWAATLLSKLPTPVKDFVFDLRTQSYQVIKRYFFAQLLIILSSGLIIWIGLTILDVKHALAITFFSMLLDFIPLIGVSVVFIPWILYSFLTQQFHMTIGLSVLLLVLIIFRNIIEPKLLGTSLGIHPFVMIILLFLFFQWFGVMGVLLTPLCLILLITIKQTGILRDIQAYLTK